MAAKVFIRTGPGERRIALTKNGQLRRVFIDRDDENSAVDGIYWGRITAINKGLNAAFVDIGLNDMGFLAAADAQTFDSTRERPKPIGQLFTEGGNVLVQVTRDPQNGKGAKLTTFLDIGTANIVITPRRPGISVSERIKDQKARKRLENILKEITEVDAGFVATTLAIHSSRDTLLQEAQMLSQDWEHIKARMELGRSPAVLLEPPGQILRFFLDNYDGDLGLILVEGRQFYEEIREIFKYRFPDLLSVVELHNSTDEIFTAHELVEQWEDLYSKSVQLPCGGSLIIEETAALTAIDVNSGKRVRGVNPEHINLEVNLEAVKEIARQIPLRNLGGQIVIDLLPQKHRENREILLKTFRDVVLEHRTNVNLVGFTRLGLFELTRRRRGKSLSQQLFNLNEDVKSPMTVALEALYQVEREMLTNPGKLFSIDTSQMVAEALSMGAAHDAKLLLERRMFMPIDVQIVANHVYSEFSITAKIGKP